MKGGYLAVNLEIVELDEPVPTIKVKGEIDHFNCQRAEAVVKRVLDEGTNKMAIDLTRVDYLDTAGVAMIFWTAKKLYDRGGRLHLVIPPGNVRRILEMAGINNAEIARRATLDDADILGIITKEVRQRHESIEAFKQGNRQDLVAHEEAELAILQEYLPQQMTRDEVVEAARRVIEEVGAQGLGDKGKVMPKLIAQLKGRADGREINAAVTDLLK